MTRQQVIEQLLTSYNDLIDPSQTRDLPGGGTGLVLMPRTYTASVRELERLIRQLRDTRHGPILKWADTNGQRFEASPRRLWWHLNAWYIDTRRTLYTPPVVPQRNKRKQLVKLQLDEHGVALPQVRVFRNAEARYPIALKAVGWLAENWGLAQEPMLPSELLAAA